MVLRYLQRVVNERDLAAVDEMVADDYEGGGHGWPQTLAELRRFYAGQASKRPDWRIDVQETLELGECVVVRAEAGGTVNDPERRLAAGPAIERVAWVAAYWIGDEQIRRIQVLELIPSHE
jgi:hypothetical protein